MFSGFNFIIKQICLFFLTTSLIFSNFAYANIVGNPTQNFNPTYSGKGFMTVHSSETISKGYLNLGLFFDYAMETLPVYPAFINRDIGDKLIFSHLGLGYGITDNWDFGMSVPSVVGQSVNNVQLRGEYADSGLLEIRALTKYRLAKFEEGGGFALIGSLGFNRTKTLPFVGDDPGPAFNLELALDKKFGRWFWGGNLGYRKLSPGDQISGFTLFQPLGDTFIFSVAGSYQFNDKWSAMGELWAAMPDADLGAVDRDENSYEVLFGGRYNSKLASENDLNFNFGLTREINHGIATPSLRMFAGVNYTFGPLFASKSVKPEDAGKPLEIKKINSEIQSEIPEQEEESNYNEGYRQGYMAGIGMGPHAGLGPQHGDTLDGGLEFPEGYDQGYIDASGPLPGDTNRPEWAKCYRIGFQGKLGNGPAAGKGPDHGEKVRPGADCPDGYRTGWNDALDKDGKAEDNDDAGESFYNPGYREGYKAGYGIGAYAGLGPDHGQTLNGGWEFPEGYYDGYIDASGPFPGDPERRVYGQAYRTGFQGKLGVGPGKNTNKDYGPKLNSAGDYPLGYEHGWIDAPDANEEVTAPVDVNLADNENANSGYNSDIETIVINTDDDVLANRRPEEEEKLQIQNITFSSNSAVITPSSDKVLANVLNYLNKYDFKTLEIWGHTDARGAALYNEKLSLARAQSVYNYFVKAGIPADKMKYDGWGERKPVAPNLGDEELRQNRRVEFIIRR